MGELNIFTLDKIINKLQCDYILSFKINEISEKNVKIVKYLPEYYDIYDDQILNYLINTSEQKLIRNICSEKD